MHGRAFLIVLVFMILSVGCGSSPTQPTSANIRGEWGGTTCAPHRPAACAVVLRIEQDGAALSGTWGRTTGGGTLAGTISGRSVLLELASSTTPNQSSTMTLTLIGPLMTGSYGTGSVRLLRVR
jgi:hypothetical protein